MQLCTCILKLHLSIYKEKNKTKNFKKICTNLIQKYIFVMYDVILFNMGMNEHKK